MADKEMNVIEEGDIPGQLGTRDGMRLAYGILWATWTVKNTAASMARHLLLAELSKEDQSIGINWANKVLGRTDDG